MKANRGLLTALFALALPVPAVAADALDWSAYPQLRSIERSTIQHGGQRLDILVRRHGEERRPVLVLVSGSVCMPVFMAVASADDTELATAAVLPGQPAQAAMGVHVAILERRNIVSLQGLFDPADVSPLRLLEKLPCTSTYGGATLGQRAEDTLAQLAYIRRQPWAGAILLAGMSEGSDVAAAVAADRSSEVHALLMMSGAGMSQFFDFVHFGRGKDDLSGVAETFSDLDAFLRGTPPPRYLGYDSARWRSFAIDASPLDNLLSSDIPVFIAHGDRDTSVPIASVDATVVELMRKQPERAIYYWSIQAAEHDLRTGNEAPADRIYPQFVAWALDHPHGRKYRSD